MRLLRTVVLCLAAGLIAYAVAYAVKYPFRTLNLIADWRGYQRDAGIAYGDLPRQRLDVYMPPEPRATPAPVVVFFYGGGWRAGDRGGSLYLGKFLSDQGFVTVIPDYRLSQEAPFPAFLEDGAKALRWVQDHVAEKGGDPQRIVLMGHSAGAYNAVMLALDHRYAVSAGFDAARIRGVVGLAGPYDFQLQHAWQRAALGDAPDYRETQPVNFAAPGAPPILLVTGDKDDTVEAENSRSLAQHLEAVHSPVVLRVLPGVSHGGVAQLFSPLGYPDRTMRNEIIRFLDDPGAVAP